MLFATTLKALSTATPFARYLIYLAPLALIPLNSFYISRPGPFVHTNNYPALIQSICLLFTATQLYLLSCVTTTYNRSSWRRRGTQIYWLTVAVAAVACGASYAYIYKWDVMLIDIATLLACWIAAADLMRIRAGRWDEQMKGRGDATQPSPKRESAFYAHAPDSASAGSKPWLPPSATGRANWEDDESTADVPWWKSDHKAHFALAVASRPLRIIHILVMLMNMLGAITLAQRTPRENPGTLADISIPNIGSTTVNYFCTTGSVKSTKGKSVVWFEGDKSQGIADFMGIQHYLLAYDLPSCSYDPPNLGGSDPLNKDLDDHSAYLPALLRHLGQTRAVAGKLPTSNQTYVGWGSAGLKLAVQHAIADKKASLLIALDPLPDGAELKVQQMAEEWTDSERLRTRSKVLAAEVRESKILLSLGVAWGLLPLLRAAQIPTPISYYPPSQISLYKLQKVQDSLLSRQLYDRIRQAKTKQVDSYLNTTSIPSRLRFAAIANQNAVPSDISLNDYWRRQKVGIAERLGGVKTNVQWCAMQNCTALFPVTNARWTAERIAGILGATMSANYTA